MVVRYEMVYTGTSVSLQIEVDKAKGGKPPADLKTSQPGRATADEHSHRLIFI